MTMKAKIDKLKDFYINIFFLILILSSIEKLLQKAKSRIFINVSLLLTSVNFSNCYKYLKYESYFLFISFFE